MGLYGNVKKVGSSTFQFDRVYRTRVEMDAAATTDGVHAGRYVLVEYGERFTKNPNESLAQNVSFSIAETSDPVYEVGAYRAHADADLDAYGAAYDSTVWQKIYTNEGDKYIMVADLNATVPKISFIKEPPITYIKVSESENQEGIIVGTIEDGHLVESAELTNAKEQINLPYFDTAVDTELSYTLHLPIALNLKVDNDDIDYNKNGFNPAYSYGEKEGVSTVAWIPEGLDNTKYTKEDGVTTSLGNPTATLNQEVDVNTKMLFMSIPALGNVMNTLYDLLYGIPETIDSEHGSLRPYFQQFAATYQQIKYPVIVNNEQVTIGGEQLTVTGTPGAEIPVPVTISGDITPADANLIVHEGYLCFNDNDNTRVMVTIGAANGENDDLEWLNRVPGLAEILANNTTGLAAVLKSIFGYSDPLTGKTRYYLYNDWETKVDDNTSDPAIINKPKIIGGYKMTFNPNAVDSISHFNPDGTDGTPTTTIYHYTSVSTATEPTQGHYMINFDAWQIVEEEDDNIDFNFS